MIVSQPSISIFVPTNLSTIYPQSIHNLSTIHQQLISNDILTLVKMVSKSSGWIIAGLSLATVATAAYFVYTQFPKNAHSSNKGELGKLKRRRKRPLPSNSSSTVAADPEQASNTKANENTLTIQSNNKSDPQAKAKEEKVKKEKTSTIIDCDSPIEGILKQSPEVKQNIFLEMMMRGEFLIQQGNIEKAVDYLMKGLNMIPNPGEILLAFEQTLPEPVFRILLERLQKEGRIRVKEYFDKISSKLPQIAFDSRESKNEVTGHSAERWFMTAARPFEEGDEIFKESSDILIRSITSPQHCEHCLKDVLECAVCCEKCDQSVYCSTDCRSKAFNEQHCFVCKGENEQVAKVYQELLNLCKVNKSSAGLLLFKYISLLLNAELQNGAAGLTSSGPFAHYDHLRPAFRQPNEVDLKEAKLLRSIFTRSNPNMQDFLTDDIYAAMKYTLLFNCYGFSNNHQSTMQNKTGEESIRNVQSSDQADRIGLFHIASHIEHSCSPNARISLGEDHNSVVISAIAPISKDQPITISFIPELDSIDKDARQIRLLSQFGLVCDCSKCSN